MDLRASGSDMMIESYVSKAVRMMIVGVKDGNPWANRESVFKYGINAESEVERYSVLN